MATNNLHGSSPDVAFVLPGGGSAGAVQVGILHSLVGAGIFPDLLVGCSVGALNAAFFALAPTEAQVDRLAELWVELSAKSIFDANRHRAVLRLIRKRDHIWSPVPLRQLIKRCCPIEDLSELVVPLQVVTTDLDMGVARWWSQGPAQEVLYATACLPGLLPPAMLDGHRHVDGGVLEPVPIRRAVDLDAQTVYVLGEANGPDDEPAGDLERAGRAGTQLRHQSLRAPARSGHAGTIRTAGDRRTWCRHGRGGPHRPLAQRGAAAREHDHQPPLPHRPAASRRAPTLRRR